MAPLLQLLLAVVAARPALPAAEAPTQLAPSAAASSRAVRPLAFAAHRRPRAALVVLRRVLLRLAVWPDVLHGSACARLRRSPSRTRRCGRWSCRASKMATRLRRGTWALRTAQGVRNAQRLLGAIVVAWFGGLQVPCRGSDGSHGRPSPAPRGPACSLQPLCACAYGLGVRPARRRSPLARFNTKVRVLCNYRT